MTSANPQGRIQAKKLPQRPHPLKTKKNTVRENRTIGLQTPLVWIYIS